jgi:hypothetical protein
LTLILIIGFARLSFGCDGPRSAYTKSDSIPEHLAPGTALDAAIPQTKNREHKRNTTQHKYGSHEPNAEATRIVRHFNIEPFSINTIDLYVTSFNRAYL